MASAVPQLQLPPRGGSVLDHVAYFAPDAAAAERTLLQLGFTVSPFTVQRNEVDGELVPAGTGNRLVVLDRGYLEILTPTGEDTPIARQFHAATARYEGIHLITFGERDAAATWDRLAGAGFDPQPVVDLTREVDTGSAPATARFEVVRVPAGRMPEGRVQVCIHHTPELVWQERWLAQPNAVVALLDVVVAVADSAEAAARFGRFTGVEPRPTGPRRWQLHLTTGSLTVVDAADLPAVVEGLEAPDVPFIAAIAVRSADLDVTRARLEANGIPVSSPAPDVAIVAPAFALGAALVVCGPGSPPPWTPAVPA